MTTEEPIGFNLQISAENTTEEYIDLITHPLLSELRELDVETANLAKGGSEPKGSRGAPITIGSIALQALPAAIPGIVTLVQASREHG